MSWRAAVAWGVARTPIELAGLSVAMLVYGAVGWDFALWDARLQLVLHLLAAGVIAGVAVAAVRGAALPRTPIDIPVLALLAALSLATLLAMNLGMSLRAMAAIGATAAMLPVALIAVRHRPSWVGLVTSVPVLALAVPTLVALMARRVEWLLVGAPGLPPLRLPAEGSLFGSVAVPPFVIWPAWALAGLIEPSLPRRVIRTGLVVVGIPLTILSGSRSAWLAIGITILIAGAPWAWRHRGRLRPPARLDLRWVAISLGLVGACVVGALLILPRLTAITSLLYRANLWRDTLIAWGTDPLLGIGPGFMPYARQAAAPDHTFPVEQPHSHNLPLGVLGDAGLLGLAAALILVVAVARVAGPWRCRTVTGRTASLVLLGLGIGGLFEDITFMPNFNLLAITLLAVALTDAGVVRWFRPATWPMPSRALALAGGAVIAAALLPAMVVADAGAIAHRAGAEAAFRARWAHASEQFSLAASIDRWHPGPLRALAVTAEAAGDLELARAAAERAVALNSGDGATWTNLALICEAMGDAACQGVATERAVAAATFLGRELVNAAFSFERLGWPAEADDAYRRSLLSQRLTSLSTDWPRQVPIRDGTLEEDFGALSELARLLAWRAMDEPIDSERLEHPAVRGLAHAMRDERSAAADWLDDAVASLPEDPLTWEIAIVVRDHWGQRTDHERRIAAVAIGSAFPPREPRGGTVALTYDIASFRAYPRDGFVTDALRLRTDPSYPWVLAETLP